MSALDGYTRIEREAMERFRHRVDDALLAEYYAAEARRWDAWWRGRGERTAVAALYQIVADGSLLDALDASRAAYHERYGVARVERVRPAVAEAHVLDVLAVLLGYPVPSAYGVPAPTDACGGDAGCDGSCGIYEQVGYVPVFSADRATRAWEVDHDRARFYDHARRKGRPITAAQLRARIEREWAR
jgi:hypothetical protein